MIQLVTCEIVFFHSFGCRIIFRFSLSKIFGNIYMLFGIEYLSLDFFLWNSKSGNKRIYSTCCHAKLFPMQYVYIVDYQ